MVVLGGIGTCAAYFLAPRGEPVGAIDLVAPAPLTVNLAARSTLSFRLDATLPMPTNEPSTRAKHNAVYNTLGESRLVLTATREGGAPSVARCAASSSASSPRATRTPRSRCKEFRSNAASQTPERGTTRDHGAGDLGAPRDGEESLARSARRGALTVAREA